MILAVLATIRAAQKHLSAAACQRLKAQKRGKVFTWPVFACLGITRVESKRNSLKRKPKMAAKCESQAKEQLNADTPLFLFDCTLADGSAQHWSSRTFTWG